MAKKRKKKVPRKGFKRTEKEWEKSIAGHLGKMVDRLTVDDVLTVACAILGYHAFEDWRWAVAGAIGYKLARTEGGTGQIGFDSPLFGVEIPFNSQAVGLGILSIIGVKGVVSTLPQLAVGAQIPQYPPSGIPPWRRK